MDIFAGFDEDLFSEQKDRQIEIDTQYEAFQREPNWFLDTSHCSKVQKTILGNTAVKMQGDHHFLIKDYFKAITCYESCIDAEKESGSITSLTWESTEGISRCFLELKYLCSAKIYCRKLLELSNSTVSLTCCFNVMFEQSMASHNFHAAVNAAKSLILMHRQNSDTWIMLAVSFAACYGVQLKRLLELVPIPAELKCQSPSCLCEPDNCEETEATKDDLVCALLHAEYHLKSVQENTIQGLPRDTNLKFYNAVQAGLQELNPNLNFVNNLMEKIRDTYCAKDSTVFNDNGDIPRNDCVMKDIIQELLQFKEKYMVL